MGSIHNSHNEVLLPNGCCSRHGVRAPSPLSIEDCLCQCESQVFTDKFGRINGNCKSTGKNWCYLKDVQSLINQYRSNGHQRWNGYNTVQAQSPVSTTCPDARTSQQFQGKVFGYHACGTPALSDYRCQELLYGGRQTTYRPPYRPTNRPTTNRPWWNNGGRRSGVKGSTKSQTNKEDSSVKFVPQ